MSFRMKESYWQVPFDRKGQYDPAKIVLPGCHYEAKRREFQALHAAGTSIKTLTEMAKDMIGDNPSKKTSPDIVEIKLRHGDIMVMDGAELQKYFEVCFFFLSLFSPSAYPFLIFCYFKYVLLPLPHPPPYPFLTFLCFNLLY
jgi:hypothetical protein